MRKSLEWLIASIVLLLGRRKRKPPKEEQRLVPPAPPDRRAESVLMLLHHSFEMLLKTMLVAETGKPPVNEHGTFDTFDQCLEYSHERQMITANQRRFLSMRRFCSPGPRGR